MKQRDLVLERILTVVCVLALVAVPLAMAFPVVAEAGGGGGGDPYGAGILIEGTSTVSSSYTLRVVGVNVRACASFWVSYQGTDYLGNVCKWGKFTDGQTISFTARIAYGTLRNIKLR